MGSLLSDYARDQMMNFLYSSSPQLARSGEELIGIRTVSLEELGLREGENNMMNDILDIKCVSGVWRVEVRLPDGGRMVVSDPGSFQDAMSKARRLEPDVEPA